MTLVEPYKWAVFTAFFGGCEFEPFFRYTCHDIAAIFVGNLLDVNEVWELALQGVDAVDPLTLVRRKVGTVVDVGVVDCRFGDFSFSH